MFPILLTIGPVALYTYSLFVFGAFFGGLFVMWRRGREAHFEEVALFDNLLVIGLWAALGARLGYVAIHAGDFGWNVLAWVNIIAHPGFWFIGALIGGVLALSRVAKKAKWEAYTLADVMVTGLVLAQAIMAMGAFFNGNGAGLVVNNWLGVQFAGMFDKRLPVQLYETALFLGWFIFLWRSEGAYRTLSWYKGTRSEAQSGYITAMYFIGVGLIELTITGLRPAELVVWSMGIDGVIYLAMFLLGMWLLSHRSGSGLFHYWLQKRQANARKINRLRDTSPMRIGDDIFG